jgi:hypothetical protein
MTTEEARALIRELCRSRFWWYHRYHHRHHSSHHHRHYYHSQQHVSSSLSSDICTWQAHPPPLSCIPSSLLLKLLSHVPHCCCLSEPLLGGRDRATECPSMVYVPWENTELAQGRGQGQGRTENSTWESGSIHEWCTVVWMKCHLRKLGCQLMRV